MNWIDRYPVYILITVVLVHNSCKKENTCDECNESNQAPIANAGADQIIALPKDSVMLDGSATIDPDGTITSYKWTKIAGPASSEISKPDSSRTIVKALVAGVYKFELTITDNDGLSAKDTVQVIVNTAFTDACDNINRPLVHAKLIPLGTLSQARVGMAVASAGNKIVFAGAALSGTNGLPVPDYGSSRVDIYDMATQTWSTAELSVWRSDVAAVAAGNKIFFAGGRLGDGAFDKLYSTVDIFDASTNTWSVASLSEPRAYIAAAAVGNKVFFAGGEKDWEYNTSNRVDIYDLYSNTWSTAQLSEARAYISAVTVNNKIYFAGGHREDRWYANPTDRIDIYDNLTNSWTTSSLSIPMGYLAGIALADKIYWAADCSVEINNVNTGTSSKASLFKSSDWVIVDGQNAVAKDNRIIFYRHYGTEDATKFDIYDITTDTWSIGIVPTNVLGASIIAVNNTIYIAGGWLNGALSNQVWKLEF